MIKARLNKYLTKVDTSKEMISIEISDEGIGIPKEEICNVFTPFFRSKNEQSREKNPNGNGLGLSICYNIAKSL
jgi:signal transduction histidine kinase